MLYLVTREYGNPPRRYASPPVGNLEATQKLLELRQRLDQKVKLFITTIADNTLCQGWVYSGTMEEHTKSDPYISDSITTVLAWLKNRLSEAICSRSVEITDGEHTGLRINL